VCVCVCVHVCVRVHVRVRVCACAMTAVYMCIWHVVRHMCVYVQVTKKR